MDRIRALLAEPVQRGLTTADELTAELEVGSQRGSARVRVVLEEMRANVHSPAESWGYRMVEGTAFAAMRWNPRILDRNGQLLGIPDGWMDDVALAWQIDSREFHLAPAHYEATVRRHTAMTSAGITVVHTLPSQLRREPSQVLRDLRRAYEHAQRRPRPPVTAVAQTVPRAA
ncbi:hypothetical protein [Allosaccharopolyspora coralli]|uniref:hypothetical protein n=1 Tax=Allosaccharopolyspora coralli TaxID=2665642 RepID=UPI001E5CF9E6|nr:hypothetical protein [Allosaccharopolyspora coralli]